MKEHRDNVRLLCPAERVAYTSHSVFALLDADTKMLTFELDPFEPGVHEAHLRPTAADLDLESHAFDEIEVRLQLDLTQDRALVRFEALAVVMLVCDRTLQLYRQPVRGEHAVLFLPSDEIANRQRPEDEDNLRPLPELGESVDLTDPVRDTLLLALPARRVAPGAESSDIQTVFADADDDAHERIDPRWEALRRLRDEGS